MNPIAVSKRIQERVRNSIRKALPVERSVPEMTNVINQFFDDNPIAQDPFLELVPDYKPGVSLADLVNEGVITRRTAEIFANYFHGSEGGDPSLIRLHEHQAQAIREVCSNEKNLVVCSGTGSGKTETFLIPLVDSLNREDQANTLCPGVRAMILYPMNALVNDQIRRLRGVLRYAPEIRFGKFTGETETNIKIRPDLVNQADQFENDFADACLPEGARLGFDDEAALPNEVTTRRQWSANPAHILVTNYAMLERLLLQPQNNCLFGPFWKYTVLDEAHCYSGALGTEIAWLIRRLKRRVEAAGAEPKKLRYLATSATLISDQCSEEEKMRRIRNEFASRLFPADPNSFAVQFGHLREVGLPNIGNRLTGQQIRTLANDDRIQRSQRFLGRNDWYRKLKAAISQIPNAQQPVAIGDLIAVMRMVAESVKASLLGETIEPYNHRMLPDDWARNHRLLLNFLVAGIGPLDQNNTWREWLHDNGDRCASSVPRDIDAQGQQNPVGNRLHLRNEWEGDLAQISLEALEWLIRCANELAVMADCDFEPNALRVIPSEDLQSYLSEISARLKVIAVELENERTALAQMWNNALQAVGVHAQGDDFQALLSTALSDETSMLRLKCHLRGAVDNAAGGERSRLNAVGEAVFPGDDNAADAVTALISLGTLAKAANHRTPVLDARYHQLIRGVECPGLRLTEDANGQVSVELLPQVMDDTLSLGLCRECGQPFALGYAEVIVLNQARHQLRATKGGNFKYLHAFSWVQGNHPDGDEVNANDSGIWVDTRQGCTTNDPCDDGEWAKVCAYKHAEDENSPEFISKCPTCETIQRNQQGSRFGIITPYEASGTQVRVVAIEELARLSDESSDPFARNHPGNGRKLLVFSDSRSGAAKLAQRLQEYTAETTMGRLAIEAVSEYDQNNLSDIAVLEATGTNPNDWDDYLENPDLMARKRMRVVPTPDTISKLLHTKLELNNLTGLLSLPRVVIQNGNENPVGDLCPTEAALYRLIETLCKKGRNGILQRRILRLSSQNLQGFNAMGIPQQQMDELISELIIALLTRVRLVMPQGFPSTEINQYRKFISNNNEHHVLRWNNDNANSLLNRVVRIAIVRYSSIWGQNLRIHLNAHSGNANVQALARELAEYDLNQIRNIAQVVCSTPEGYWLNILQNQLAIGYAQAPTRNVLNRVRSFFVDLAFAMMNQLWGPFSNANGLLVASANNGFELDPLRLLLFVSNPVEDVEKLCEEDLNLATREIIPLRIEEHTAQIATERGSSYQRAFSDGRINILSCSTTFEMGVDLGDLNCVFLNGMPPSVANYRQRAGRAGRRPGSSSYALTFLSDSSHDRYYWEKPGELLFGPMEAPKIYLENSIFRARHLRAEAMHHFLNWLSADGRITDQTACSYDSNGNQQIRARKRKWNTVGDFFIGLAAGRHHQGCHPVISRFRPLVKELPDWRMISVQDVQQYVEGISDVGQGSLDYSIADDLVWQLLTQPQNPIKPYHEDAADVYHKLGGPHFPGASDHDLRRRELEFQACQEFGNTEGARPGTISPYQNHLLHEQTITWVTRGRLLPKYGFPVDVIRLLPDSNDPHGADVKLERDLRIGLYEYAPGQKVTANKRIFPSSCALVYQNGMLVRAGGNATVRLLCNSCHEPDWSAGAMAGQSCRFCGDHGQLQAVNLCRPDVFRASRSHAGSSIHEERGSALHVHTGAFRDGIQVAEINLIAKESNSGTITYINRGAQHYGFYGGEHASFSLYHEVRTDIAAWMLSPLLFANGRQLQQMSLQYYQGVSRLNTAMKSALHAILRAAARVKGVEDRDLGGLVQPGIYHNGELGFVIFDEASGGGGAVLDMILTGNPVLDTPRAEMIRRILNLAIQICEQCNCGEIGHHVRRIPIPRINYLALDHRDQTNVRPIASCYKCLRNHRNQREHSILDRHDAAQLIRELLTNNVPFDDSFNLRNLPINLPNTFRFCKEDGTLVNLEETNSIPHARQWVLIRSSNGASSYGEWFLTERQDGTNIQKRLRLLNGVGLDEGMMISEDELAALKIWTLAL